VLAIAMVGSVALFALRGIRCPYRRHRFVRRGADRNQSAAHQLGQVSLPKDSGNVDAVKWQSSWPLSILSGGNDYLPDWHGAIMAALLVEWGVCKVAKP